MKARIRSLAALLALATFTHTAGAQMQVTITPSKDNTLYESTTGSESNGAGDHLFAGTTNVGDIRRAVLAFDVSGNVPAGMTVDSVKLTMSMSKTKLPPSNHLVALHPLTQDWGEGTSDAPLQEGGGGIATAGDATWLHTFYDTQMWNTPGGDFEATPSATVTVSGVATYTWGSSPEMVADVQGWLDDEANNFGWILIGDEIAAASAKRFDSRESGAPPQLQIFYSIPTAVERPRETPAAVALLSSYPNPFVQTTSIEYSVSDGRDLRLEVYDTLGRHVTTLAEGFHSAGRFVARFDGRGLPSGVYFFRIESRDFSQYRQVVLIH